MFRGSFAILVLLNMKILKKFCAWEKRQMKNPETILAVWLGFGVLFGVGIDNVGAGIAIGVAIGVAMSMSQRKKNKDNQKEEENSADEK